MSDNPSIFQVGYRLFSTKGGKWVWGSLLCLLFILLHLLTKGLQLQYRARPALAGTRAGWLCPDRAVLGHSTDGSSCQPGLMSWIQPHVNAAAMFLAAEPVSLCGVCLRVHVACLYGAELFVQREHLKLCQKLCVLHEGFSFWGEGQELLFPAQLVARLYSFPHLPTSNGHAAPLLVPGTRLRKHAEVKVLGCSLQGIGADCERLALRRVGRSEPGPEAAGES